MKRKKIIFSVLILLLALIILPKAYKIGTYRKQSINYLEDKYNEEFNLSLIPKRDFSQCGKYYEWKAASKSYPGISFRIIRNDAGINELEQYSDVTYSDTYADDIFENAIIEHYQKISNSHWNDPILDCSPRNAYSVYNTYDEYLKNVPASVHIYVKYDDNFNYDAEAEKIYNLIKDENEASHTMHLEIYYINDEAYTNLYNDQPHGVSESFGWEERYFYSLNTNGQNDFQYLTKELIIDDMKTNKERFLRN